MKVEWHKRARQDHARLRQVERVKARLTGQIIGDITLGVPVITEDMLRRLTDIVQAMVMLEDRMEDLREDLHACLNYVRGENDVEGWAEVHIVERTPDLIVADIRHCRVKEPAEKPPKGHSVVTRHMPSGARRRRGRS